MLVLIEKFREFDFKKLWRRPPEFYFEKEKCINAPLAVLGWTAFAYCHFLREKAMKPQLT